ncbi:MAG: hypothetical protein PHX83_12215 [Acidobacteriia bacterium]|nr:hypothetical protein [Terriglobia bacterium]
MVRMKLTPVEKFEILLKALHFPEPAREYRFHPTRKWRFDYAWERMAKQYIVLGSNGFIKRLWSVAVEIEGGEFVKSRHRSPIGYAKDCEKYNHAQRLGWKVYRFTPSMITEENMKWLKEEVEG